MPLLVTQYLICFSDILRTNKIGQKASMHGKKLIDHRREGGRKTGRD